MSRLAYPGRLGIESAADQTEFPLRVAVCAWCKPRELGATIGALSHGICPRHFREMKSKLQSGLSGREGALVGQRPRRSRALRMANEEIAQLRFPFPAPSTATSHLSA
jgi:hypothetical protein